MDTGGTPEDGQHAADNVIRFPRDWFGSKDDLIPIGPAADRLEAAAAAEREAAYALSADDFWGEGAGALHQPVDVPRAGTETTVRLQAITNVGMATQLFSPARLWRFGSLRLSSVARATVPRRRPRASRLEVPRAALLLTAMLIAALGLFVSGEFTGHAPARRIVSREVASPVRVAQSLSLPVQEMRARLASERQPGLPLLRRSHAAAKADRTSSTRHRASKADRTRAEVHRAVKPPAAEQTVAAPAESVTTQHPETIVTEIAPRASGSASERQPSTTTAASSSAASSARASTAPSGPSGLGGAVGPQCNPICSG